MDMDDEMRRLKWMLAAGVLFLVSAYFSWRELKYVMFGTQTDATLVRVYETTEPGRRGRLREILAVEYQFKESGGTVRKETDTLQIDTDRPTGPTVRVQYLDGSVGRSRLSGNTRRIWLLLLFASLSFLGFKVFQLIRESKR